MPGITRMAARFALLAAAMMLSGACARLLGARPLATARSGGTTFHEVAVGAARRGYLLHRPADTRTPLPVLFVLHGTSANANVVMDESGMNEVGDSTHALVVYPNGTAGIPYIRLFWNTEHCCGPQDRSGADESGLIHAIIDSLAVHFSIDRSRVGLIGFSDAGTLAYLLACDDSDVLTSVAVLSGELPATRCVPPVGVSTLVLHGTADRNMRYENTPARVAEWATRQRCAPAAVDTIPSVIRTRYESCADRAAVELYTIRGGRHAWPGGRRSTPVAPRPTADVSASRIFADFVIAHPRVAR
jgi:polyhydroxybutyrate depolymerase